MEGFITGLITGFLIFGFLGMLFGIAIEGGFEAYMQYKTKLKLKELEREDELLKEYKKWLKEEGKKWVKQFSVL